MIKTIFEVGVNLIETLILLDFLTRYLGCKYEDWRKYVGFISTWFISFLELCLINYMTDFEGIAMCIPVIISFIYAVLCLEGRPLLKLWISSLTQIIVILIAIGTNLLVCQIIGYNPNDMITVFNSTRVISVIITKVLLFYVTRIILKHKHKNPLDAQTWVMLILIPFISFISLSALMMAAIDHEEISGYIMIGMSGILLANMITYYFFSVLNREYEERLRLKLVEQNQENTVRSLEDANAFVQQMRSVRHDIQNQLLIISGLVEGGRYDRAKEHIKNMIENYLPQTQSLIHSDNEAFNAIVNAKVAVCNQKRIYLEVRQMQNALDCLDPIDIGILFGNLLDNAIEAAEHTQRRRISVDVSIQGFYLSVLVKNSIQDSVVRNNDDFKTTKKDKELHGIGLKNVRELVRKYDGMLDFYEEAGEFCCHIILGMNRR